MGRSNLGFPLQTADVSITRCSLLRLALFHEINLFFLLRILITMTVKPFTKLI